MRMCIKHYSLNVWFIRNALTNSKLSMFDAVSMASPFVPVDLDKLLNEFEEKEG